MDTIWLSTFVKTFTYQFNTTSHVWINNGQFSLPTGYPSLSMEKDTLVATLSNHDNHPTLCGYVYKLSIDNNNNNNNENNNDNSDNGNADGIVQWKHNATLTTRTDLITGDQDQTVSVEGHYVYIGRWGIYPHSVGKVFVCDTSNI